MADIDNTQAIIDAAREGQKTAILVIEHDGVRAPVLVRSTGKGAISVDSVRGHIDAYRDNPERRTGTAALTELDSFIAHALRFKDDGSAVFVVAGKDEEPPSLLSVFDYHDPVNDADGKIIGDGSALPRFGKHRGVYRPQYSPEWEAWTGADKRPMTQAEFADFIETNAVDLFDGDSDGFDKIPTWFAGRFGGKVARDGGPESYFATVQRMIDLCGGLSVTVEDAVTDMAERDTATGATRISFVSKTSTGEVSVPPAFVIAIPIYDGGPAYQIPARLKMRAKSSGDTKRVEWSFEIYGADRQERACIKSMRETVATTTGLPVFMGSPET